MRFVLSAVLVVLPAMAGCLQETQEALDGASMALPLGPQLAVGPLPTFSLPKIIDDVRSGGEPVIAVTAKGTILVSSHPGYTHIHPNVAGGKTGVADAVTPTQAQSYMWRSVDGGQTWTHLSLLGSLGGPAAGPRGIGQGVGDPEFTIDGNGRIWFTDLEALAQGSVSWSDDDGKTWLMGNNVASAAPMDRQWLASYQDTLYFTGNFFTDSRVLATKDGVVYERRGEIPGATCSNGDVVAHPTTGVLYASCNRGLAISTDGARTWRIATGPFQSQGSSLETSIPAEPSIDAAGAVYLARSEKLREIRLGWTHDDGKTWRNMTLASYFPELGAGAVLWPWTSAGSEGRVSVTFYGSPSAKAGTSQQIGDASTEWYVYNVIILDASSEAPLVYPTKLTAQPFHKGAICIGTTCQAGTAASANFDRRLGDFFETTIDPEGFLHVVYADTTAESSDAISHVAYVRLTDGPRLVEGTLPKGFPTQG